MIMQAFMNFFKGALFTAFNWVNLPSLPASLIITLNNFLDLIFANASVVGFFVRPATLDVVIPLLIVIINFDKIYKFVMFVLRKIPFVGID